MKRYAIIFIIPILLLACKKSIQVDPPINPIVSEVVFGNDSSAISSLTGIYFEMMNGSNGATQFSSSGITIFTGMYSDELRYFAPSFRDEFQKSFLSQGSHDLLVSFLWDRAYRYIYTANVCMEGLNKSTKLTSSIKTRLLGEALFIRAFCYFHLVNIFGAVPMPLTGDYRVNITLGRSSESEVYDRIIKDLKEAQTYLPDTYDNSGRIRPIKWAATALLARVLLYQGDWAGAEDQSSSVINSAHFSLLSDPAFVFRKESRETIWQLFPSNTPINTFEGGLFIPSSSGAVPGYLMTDSLLKAFEMGDSRRLKWVGARIYSGYPDSLYYPAKYKVRTAIAISENYVVLRLAEQYLIRSEARARQNKLTEAQDDINKIRNRAGLENTTAMSLQDLLAAIERERRIELFAEWGNRWYDLKRTNRANEVLGLMKPATWKSTATLWPIPISQIRANPALTQNPGY